MIEVADGNATYYYHKACPERSRGDALGSVIALSHSSGDTVQTYEYSVFGEPAVEDPNHTNPYMFAGRRYDAELGLYYNRAMYYNPYTGRFLQTDPSGYSTGINWYHYCNNDPVNYIDFSGREPTYSNGTWTRNPKDGHPPSRTGGAYYMQQHKMSCVAAGILNWWVTYNASIPEEARDSDWDAETYVINELNDKHDWDLQGFSNWEKIVDMAGFATPSWSGNMIRGDAGDEKTRISADEVRRFVGGQKRAVMFGIDIDPRGDHDPWHLVLIVPTPQSYLDSDEIADNAIYLLVDSYHDEGVPMTMAELSRWFLWYNGKGTPYNGAGEYYRENRLSTNYVVGERVPIGATPNPTNDPPHFDINPDS